MSDIDTRKPGAAGSYHRAGIENDGTLAEAGRQFNQEIPPQPLIDYRQFATELVRAYFEAVVWRQQIEDWETQEEMEKRATLVGWRKEESP